jgi:hypothetical protein
MVEIFSGLFSAIFLPNSAILRPPIMSGNGQFFRASFKVFGRKIGHLATVIPSPPSPLPPSIDLLPKICPLAANIQYAQSMNKMTASAFFFIIH